MNLHLERALFVVAPQNSGKSTLLRSIFLDRRLGREGKIPTERKLNDDFYLTNERRLYLRLTSPHETGETPEEFLTKTRSKMVGGRWCFAGPLQPDEFKNMPGIVQCVNDFVEEFTPERVRVVFLSLDRKGKPFESLKSFKMLSHKLLRIPSVEVVCIDARRKQANGLFLADFFDFT